ncbi:MAG: hypothetical protein JWO56_1944 [Acidobacteria bacterium]|nr:hypothetical protein [Acidobacteriota bacterium]
MKRLVLLVIFLAVFLPVPMQAWTRASDQRIAKKAIELAPPDLRLVLDRFPRELQRGLEKAEGDEGSAEHHYFVLSRTGNLRERIHRETDAIVKLLRNRQPMALVAERLGMLSHLVADANNPFHLANDDARLDVAHDDFEQYFERRMARFPTVFYGLDPAFQPGSYFDRTFDRTRKLYPLMGEEYFRGGEPRTSADFDDRSTAFGVASVCYSHAVTDLVNLYYYIWKEAGGDVRSAAMLRSGGRASHAN